MPRIRIDYDEDRQFACLNALEDCTDSQWSAIRRFWEERYPQLITNEYRGLSLPWWAFLSSRDSFRYVLSINGVSGLDVSGRAQELLVEAKKRADRYVDAETYRVTLSPQEIESRLSEIGFERKLLPYQVRNVSTLVNLLSGATFSVPGAGKTTEALAYYFLTRSEKDKLLVIAPKNAFVAWEDELPACMPGVKFGFVRLTGGQSRINDILSRNPEALIISYQQLPRVIHEVRVYLESNPVFLFIDESHRMKRGQGGVHGAVILGLSHLAKRKLILSGTPMPNSPADLVPQFMFLYPEFTTKPEDVVEKLKPVFVRTTKKELGLETPQRILHKVPMSNAQAKLYEILASDAARRLAGFDVRDRLMFRHFARCVQHMLQAASNPALLLSSELSNNKILMDALAEGVSSKLQAASALTREWVKDGQKVLIWSSFVKTVEHLAGLLSDIGAHYIHGGVTTSEEGDDYDSRESKIREFNKEDSPCRVLVANPAACSEGISLHHVCHRAIYVDRNYNAAQYLQSEDRIHRIGLSKDVKTFITILCSPGTIDESVNRRLQLKVANMGQVLDDPNLNIKPLDLDEEDEIEGLDAGDIEDLRQLFGIVH
jgi:SNF2 family DNA or RNA helicase